MSEVLRVDEFISTTLMNDASLAAYLGEAVRVYPGVAPEGKRIGRYISYSDVTSPVANTATGDPVFAKPTYVVKVHGVDTGYQALKQALDRIQFLMTSRKRPWPQIVDGYYVGRWVRRNGMRSIDDQKNVRVFWVGETYSSVVYPIEGYASIGN